MQHLPNLLPAIFLLGPTASGKSRIALEIADRFPVEIISVDSAQYTDIWILARQAGSQTLTRVTHHLINLIDPDQRYSAAASAGCIGIIMKSVNAQVHYSRVEPCFISGHCKWPFESAAGRYKTPSMLGRNGKEIIGCHARKPSELDEVTASDQTNR